MKTIHFIMRIEIITNKKTTKLFLDHVFQYHGILEYIIFDCGLQFTFKLWK
jgi:hypothetical protein